MPVKAGLTFHHLAKPGNKTKGVIYKLLLIINYGYSILHHVQFVKGVLRFDILDTRLDFNLDYVTG